MSETTNLKLFMHDNPETNEDLFDITKSLNENWDKTDEFAGKTNKNIENLIEENERLKEDLNNSTITSSSSGENITIEGSAEARFKKLVVKGNSYQETSKQGKNLFDFEKATDVNNLNYDNTYSFFEIKGVKPETNYTFSGISDFVAEEGKSHYIGLTGGNTYNTGPATWCNWIVRDNSLITNTLTTYCRSNGKLYLIVNTASEGNEGTNKQNFVDVVKKHMQNVQIEEGTKATEYEPFIPNKPSPEHPSEIRNCGDNVNSFDLKSWFENCATVSCTKILLENGIRMQFKGPDPWLGSVITEQGAAPQESSKKAAIEVFEDTDYILSISATPKCFISFHDKDYISINYKQIPSSDKETSYSFKTPKNCKYILLRLGKNDPNYTTDTTFDFTNIKLERGTKATPYSPYGCGNVNVNIKDNAKQQQKISFPTKEGQVLHKGDYLADDGIHQTRKTIELDGTINMFRSVHPSVYTDTHHFFLMEISDKYNKGANGSTEYCLCSHLKISNQTPSNAIKETCLWWEGSSKVIYCSLPFENSYSIANNWLKELKEAGTPVKLEYKLENEIIEPYSPEQQEAWEQIKNAKTYKGTTYIFSDDEISPEFEEEHLVDLEAYINNKLGVKANNEPQQEIPNQPSMEQPQLEETKVIGGEE